MITLEELTSKLNENDKKEFIKNYRMFRSDFKSGGAGWCWMSAKYYPVFVKYYQNDIIDECGETLLTTMVKNGKANNIITLLHSGDNIDQKNVRGLTPLMLAVMGNHPMVVKKLLACGADKTITNNNGQTALDLAEMFGATRCIKYLTQDAE